MHTRTPTFRELDYQRTKDEMPEDFGRHTRRCKLCNAWLCRWNPDPVCYCHKPQGEGVLIEVAPGLWRRFVLAERERVTDDLFELMAEA